MKNSISRSNANTLKGRNKSVLSCLTASNHRSKACGQDLALFWQLSVLVLGTAVA